MQIRASRAAAVGAACIAGLTLVSGAAWAASGGGFTPQQQDCPGNAFGWNTPPGTVTPGCHNTAVNIETGNTTNGVADPGNTRFAELGIDELPIESHNPSFGVEEHIGDPGTPDSPHSGCLAVNTDGTGGGTGVGCGNNPAGTGFELNFDYYQLYCPLAALLPLQDIPVEKVEVTDTPSLFKCAADQPIGKTTLTPDTGTADALTQIITQGLTFYTGSYDNLDNGEHDGFSGNNNTDGAINGPSDGGGNTLSVTPQNAGNAHTAANPEGLINESLGFCADGICLAGTTQQQTVYKGCDANVPGNNVADDQCAPGTPKSGDVFENDTPASTQEVNNCSSGGPNSSETACYTNQNGSPNPGGANAYRQHTPTDMNVEPGIQTYQDPDPQRSPALPYGLPGVYAGTCGVFVKDTGGEGNPGITGLDLGWLGGISNC